MTLDPKALEAATKALQQKYREFWSGSWPASEEARELFRAGYNAFLSASIPADAAGEVKELRRLEEFGTATDEATVSALGRAAALISALSADLAAARCGNRYARLEVQALRRAEAAEARVKKLDEALGNLLNAAQYVGTEDDPHWAIPDGEISAARSVAKEAGK